MSTEPKKAPKKKKAQPSQEKKKHVATGHTPQSEPKDQQDKEDVQKPEEAKTLEQFSIAVEQDSASNQKDEDFTAVPYSKTYKTLARFLGRYNKRSSIEIPKDRKPISCARLSNVHIFSSKPKQGHNEDIIDHIQRRHPSSLKLIEKHFAEHSPPLDRMGKIEAIMKQVVENTKPGDIEESSEFITPSGFPIPVNVIKFTAKIEIDGEMENVTCVFSKPRLETLQDYRNASEENENANVLVARTLYIHSEVPTITGTEAFSSLVRSPASKALGSNTKKKKKKKKEKNAFCRDKRGYSSYAT